MGALRDSAINYRTAAEAVQNRIPSIDGVIVLLQKQDEDGIFSTASRRLLLLRTLKELREDSLRSRNLARMLREYADSLESIDELIEEVFELGDIG